MQNQSRMRLLIVLGGSLALALLLAACYPGEPTDLGDVGLAITISNPEGNYDGLTTWAMKDTVVALIDPDDNSSMPLDRSFDDLILENIASQMDALGFIRVEEVDGQLPVSPDVVVSVGAVQSDAWLSVIYYGGYWGYPGYGWGYPSQGYYKYTQGTVVWTMTDWRDIPEDDPDYEFPVLWVAGINGALSGEGSVPTNQAITNGIDQCFSQSTYIQADAR
ncbi:MAG: hypothetical protein GY780_17060 [bacterium]|nr:hypothetical protein [bacterium]